MKKIIMLSALISTIALFGCGKNKDDRSMAEKGGEKLGRGLRQFSTGVSKGVDEARQAPIELSEALAASGLKCTLGKVRNSLVDDSALVVYLIADKDFNATLLARAYNNQKQEIGRAKLEVSLKAQDAQYMRFVFPDEMDISSVDSYEITQL